MKKLFQTRNRKHRVILLRRRHLAIPAALLCICALCLVANLPAYVTAAASARQLPIYCVQREQKLCALSFDAAWGDAILRQPEPCHNSPRPPMPNRHRGARFFQNHTEKSSFGLWRLTTRLSPMLPKILILSCQTR